LTRNSTDEQSIKKYNTGIVQELTGLSGDELYKFIGELGFEDKYLLQASDYEIREKSLKNSSSIRNKRNLKTKPIIMEPFAGATPTIGDIELAHSLIKSNIHRTPILTSEV
jgi:hypothetical protein